MTIIRKLAALVFAVCLLATACGSDNDGPGASCDAGEVQVSVLDSSRSDLAEFDVNDDGFSCVPVAYYPFIPAPAGQPAYPTAG